MEKNIVVTDTKGNVIGSTWPKRAKGLIRSGRAVEAGEGCIRLLSTPPSASAFENTEDEQMSQIIEFKARDFKLNADCDTNTGSRQIVTAWGTSVECFEIGDAGALSGKTQIVSEKYLEGNTDYVFRFAMYNSYSGHESASSQVSVYQGNDLENAYTYPLDRSGRNRFQPVFCKKDGNELVRVFEIPFTTENADGYRIMIQVSAMEARIYPARENEAYAELPDVDYEQWKQEEQHKWVTRLNDFGTKTYESLGELGSQLGDKLGEWGNKLSKKVGDMVNSAQNTAQNAAQAAQDAAQKAEETASQAAEEAQEAVQDAVQEAEETVETVQGTIIDE